MSSKRKRKARRKRRARAKRVTTRTVSTRTVTQNPVQAGGKGKYVIVACKGVGKHKQTLYYDGSKFGKRARPATFTYKNEADWFRRQIQQRFGAALRGWDVLTK